MTTNRSNRCFLIVLLSALCFVSGCLSSAPENPESNFLDNRVASERIELALSRDRKFDFSHVQVKANGGTIYLLGRVSSEQARQLAEQIALSSPRSARVENKLQTQ